MFHVRHPRLFLKRGTRYEIGPRGEHLADIVNVRVRRLARGCNVQFVYRPVGDKVARMELE